MRREGQGGGDERGDSPTPVDLSCRERVTAEGRGGCVCELDMEERDGIERSPRTGFYEADIAGGAEWTVPDRYRDLRPLGIGTFGTVW